MALNNGQGASGMNDNSLPSGYNVGHINKYSPQGNEIYKNATSFVDPNSFLSKIAGGDQSAFAEMEAPAMRQFNQLQGENASRFSGMGTGARRGSGFQNFQNQATSDFAQDLASKRMEYRMNSIKDLQNFSHQLLGDDPYEKFVYGQEKKKKWWEKLIGGGSGLIGGGLGFLAGGPAGAVAGYNMGNEFGKAFQ